ncbi:hypothetical protein LF1_17750 [Rubripirellula obstinata]|uniref:Uncharacterized protein n=1 Tax=Rubripirellula obstinata TaxID=406547 RepID=A0A5B1CFD6_9BACT|nr:hypothetical protein LF1_17750 [Rubripirellula obstinata]
MKSQPERVSRKLFRDSSYSRLNPGGISYGMLMGFAASLKYQASYSWILITHSFPYV